MWIMAKRQTTLFGEVLPLKRKHCVYSNPTDTYQKFVEVYAKKNGKAKTKEAVVKEAQMKWKEMIKDEIEDYVKDVDFNTEPTAENKRVKVRDYGFSLNEAQRCPLNESDSESEILGSTPDTNFNHDSSTVVSPPLPLTLFMNQVCPGKVEKILTNDVLSNQSSMSILLPFAEAYLYYVRLKISYESRQQRKRDTNLSEVISKVDEAVQEVTLAFEKVGEIQLPTTLGVQQLANRAVQKVSVLTEAVKKAVYLKSLVCNKGLLNSLRRRLSQQAAYKLPSLNIQCVNSSTFTWQDAFYQLVDMMNSGTASNIKSPLSLIQLIEIAEILEQNVSVEVNQFLVTYNLNSKFSAEMCQQIVKYFPIWWLHSSNDDILLNVHELFLTDGCLESLISVHDEAQVNYTKPRRATKQDKGGGSKHDHSKSGRPALVEMFPDIVDVASEFIKNHGYSAHARRRESVACTPGVSLADIRNHLLQHVPGLKEHGISVHTVARLMKPPRRDTTSARRYKGFISARVPGKKNCYREPNIDQHYLFARVAYRRELASMFLEECAVFSCDNMNKIKVGALAVSRYHQIERLYDTSDVPNYPDHDFPVPGYHLIPAGYMRLTSKSSTVSTSSDIDVMNDVLLEPSQNDHTEPPDCDNEVQYCSSLNSTPPISDTCISSDNEVDSQVDSSLGTSQASQHCDELLSPTPQTSSPDANDQESTDLELVTSASVTVDSLGMISAVATTRVSKPLQMPNSSVEASVNQSSSLTMVSASATIPVHESSHNHDSSHQSSHRQTSAGAMYNGCSTDSEQSCFYFDKLNRKHYITPHTGPAIVCVRASKFYSSTSHTHTVDLMHIFNAVVMEKRTAVTLLVDGGPDWSTASLLNCLFFYRLWRDVGLDMLVVCSYAARYSSYNPIEHLWSPLSKKLSGVQFSAKAPGDRKPPCQLSGITAEERRQKEAVVFDSAINELCSVHWANVTYDSYPCHFNHINCIDDTAPLYDDYNDVQCFLRCPLRDIKAGKFQSIAKEMQAMLKHIRRHRNEVIIMKCQNENCPHCSQHPIIAKKLFQFLKERDMKMFAPVSSTDNIGHYSTFIEMCDKNHAELPIGDTGMPSAANSDLGNCPVCPSFTFLSKTEKKRHLKVFHRTLSNGTQRKQKSSVKHTCEFKVDKNTKCGLHFDSRYKLAKHRKQVGHQVPRNQQPCTSTQENTMSYYLQTVEANMRDNRFSTMIADIFNENNDQEMDSEEMDSDCEKEMDSDCEQEMVNTK